MVDALLRNEVVTYAGQYYQLHDASFLPGPIQRPRPPLTLGAHGPRMLGIVARHADAWNSFGTLDEMRERNAILDDHCAKIGRDPGTIRRSLYGWAAMLPYDPWESVEAFQEVIGRYREVGVDEFIIDQPPVEQFEVVERVAAEVLPKLRG